MSTIINKSFRLRVRTAHGEVVLRACVQSRHHTYTTIGQRYNSSRLRGTTRTALKFSFSGKSIFFVVTVRRPLQPVANERLMKLSFLSKLRRRRATTTREIEHAMATLAARCTFVDCSSNTAYTPRYGLHPKRAARKKARPAAM